MAALFKLLNETFVHDDFYTHVSLMQPYGKYSIASVRTWNQFWKLYCETIEEKAIKIGLAEVPQNVTQLVIDVDIIDVNEEMRGKLIDSTLTCLWDILESVLELNNARDLVCVLLEKPAYSHREQIKHGFHLQFPFLFLSKVAIEVYILPRLWRAIPTLQTKNTHLDCKASTNAWLMYGSCKNEESEPYTVSKVLSPDGDLTLDVFNGYALYDLEDNEFKVPVRDVEQFLPRILSIHPCGRKETKIKAGVAPIRPQTERVIPKPAAQKEKTTLTQLQIQKLVDMLSPSRAEGHDDWMYVGWTLFNITSGSDFGLDLWTSFSRQTPDHPEDRCIYEWSKMEVRNLNCGTLRFMAKKDAPEKYAEFIRTDMCSSNKLGSHYDVAYALYQHVSEQFVFTGNNMWYKFENHFWNGYPNSIELRRLIETIVVPYFANDITKLRLDLQQCEEEDLKREIAEQLANKVKTLGKLKSSGYKNSILKECEELFYDPLFEESLNVNRYLIGFRNGVYDLKQDVFRNGEPCDRLTKCLPIEYKPATLDEQDTIHDFFNKVFPDNDLRKYVWDVLSELFEGYNHRKCVWFCTGIGDNAKSVFQSFIEKMMGPLSVTLPTTLLTSKRAVTGSATAELARTGDGVRVIWLEEPDQDEQIYSGVFKHLSGNDSYYSRDLYQRGKEVREIQPMYKIFIICNDLPNIRKGGDKATWNRVRVIPFESTFTRDAPDDLKEQYNTKTFPIDTRMAEKLGALTGPLAWMLLQHRHVPRSPDPPLVVAETQNYKTSNDVVGRFLQDNLVEAPDSLFSMFTLYSIYNDFLQLGNLKSNFNYDLIKFEHKLAKQLPSLQRLGNNIYKGFKIVKPPEVNNRDEL